MHARRWIFVLLAAVAASGCATTDEKRRVRGVEFVQTDPSYQRADRATDVEVYLDRLPDRAYRSVGIIEARRHHLTAAVDAAIEKAREIGCDYLIDRRLHSPTTGAIAPTTWVLSATDIIVVQPVPGPSSPSRIHQFICGVRQ